MGSRRADAAPEWHVWPRRPPPGRPRSCRPGPFRRQPRWRSHAPGTVGNTPRPRAPLPRDGAAPLDAHEHLEQRRPLRLRHVDEKLLDPRPFPVRPAALEPLGRRLDPAPVSRRDVRHGKLRDREFEARRRRPSLVGDRQGDVHLGPWRSPASRREIAADIAVDLGSIGRSGFRSPSPTRRRLVLRYPGTLIASREGTLQKAFPRTRHQHIERAS